MDTPEEAEPEEVEELMDRQQLHGNNMIDRCDFGEWLLKLTRVSHRNPNP